MRQSQGVTLAKLAGKYVGRQANATTPGQIIALCTAPKALTGDGAAAGGNLAWQVFDAQEQPIGRKGTAEGTTPWNFGAVAARPTAASP